MDLIVRKDFWIGTTLFAEIDCHHLKMKNLSNILDTAFNMTLQCYLFLKIKFFAVTKLECHKIWKPMQINILFMGLNKKSMLEDKLSQVVIYWRIILGRKSDGCIAPNIYKLF